MAKTQISDVPAATSPSYSPITSVTLPLIIATLAVLTVGYNQVLAHIWLIT